MRPFNEVDPIVRGRTPEASAAELAEIAARLTAESSRLREALRELVDAWDSWLATTETEGFRYNATFEKAISRAESALRSDPT